MKRHGRTSSSSFWAKRAQIYKKKFVSRDSMEAQERAIQEILDEIQVRVRTALLFGAETVTGGANQYKTHKQMVVGL